MAWAKLWDSSADDWTLGRLSGSWESARFMVLQMTHAGRRCVIRSALIAEAQAVGVRVTTGAATEYDMRLTVWLPAAAGSPPGGVAGVRRSRGVATEMRDVSAFIARQLRDTWLKPPLFRLHHWT